MFCFTGKLQVMDRLLHKLKSEGHRVLIFTQMTRMLDILEQFLNFHGHIYLRLDGTTRVDQRQVSHGAVLLVRDPPEITGPASSGGRAR